MQSKHREIAVYYYCHFSNLSIAVLEREGISVKILILTNIMWKYYESSD